MLRFSPLFLLSAALASAQTPEVVQKVDAKLDAERAAQRNEDVEILRRLLNKAAGLPDNVNPQTYKVDPESTPSYPKWRPDPATRPPVVGPFDGVYLPGAGVVFTLHVPAGAGVVADDSRLGLNQSCVGCHAGITAHDRHHASPVVNQCSTCHDTAVSPPSPLSDWERVRSDVRGEKPKPADPTPKKEKPRAAVCGPGSLQTLITGVLAANAKNVRHLPEKEGITVVVTFDEVSGTRASAAEALLRNYYHSDGIEPVRLSDRPVLDHPPSKPGFTADELKALALGDLHLKQGKHKEAADAYAAALGRFTDKQFKLNAPATLTAEQRNQLADEFQKGVRDAMKSYAKALLLADQPEAARKALELATEFVVLEVTPTTVPASPTAPAKLIVSVPKPVLDIAKNAAEFKSGVKVERVNFPDAKK